MEPQGDTGFHRVKRGKILGSPTSPFPTLCNPVTPCGKKPRFLRLVRNNQDGQVLVIGLFVALGLAMVSIAVANIGIMVSEKMHLQDTVDAAAYSSAVVEARYMNLAAYINRAMVANYDSMAFNTALWAVADSNDHGLAVITAIIYEVAFVVQFIPLINALAVPIDLGGDAFHAIHYAAHKFNQLMNDMFAQDDDAQDLNQYIEMMNVDLLTLYSGLIYAAVQSGRYSVAQEVAHKMDPNIMTTSVLGMGAEAMNYDELARAVDWVIRDTDARSFPFSQLNSSFNKMMDEAEDTDDHPVLLAAVTEASLDPFAAGRSRLGEKDQLRSFGADDLIPFAGAIEFALDAECYLECTVSWIWGGCDCDSEFELDIGTTPRWAQETKANQDHVPAIARRRMREVNFFGITVNVHGSGLAGEAFEWLADKLASGGHTSGDIHNDICNVANFLEGTEHIGETIAALCFPPLGGYNLQNIVQSGLAFNPTALWDDHWDGSFDAIPDHQWEPYPPTGTIDSVDYAATANAEGLEDGVPKYDWKVDLDNVGFPLYHYPTDGAQERPDGTSAGGEDNILSGPSIAVVGVKPWDKIKGLRGLKLHNTYSPTAMARSQVYYLRSKNRPTEKPSLFNPHWVARLAPIDSEDTPVILRKGLPFVSSIGIPIAPTH